MKNILCYGDSNTWGFIPGKFNFKTMYMERYNRDVRWTGLLQKYLGDGFYIIEEGLNGRTTNISDPNITPDRNGKSYLIPCLYTHAPLDLVVIMLGANDLKSNFNRSTEDISNGIKELVQMIQTTKYGHDMQSPPAVLLVGYPVVSNDDGGIYYGDPDLFKNAVSRSKQFDSFFSKVAKELNCYYIDMSTQVQLSEIDGIHLDERGHAKFASVIAEEVKKILS